MNDVGLGFIDVKYISKSIYSKVV